MSDDEVDPSDDETNGGEANSGASTDFADRVVADKVRARLDTMLEVLSNQRRRNVLYYLLDHNATAIDTLARQLTAWQIDEPVAEVSAEACEQMKIDLYHIHLPKLTDAGIIEYDRRSGAILYRQPPEMLEQCLQFCQSLETVE